MNRLMITFLAFLAAATLSGGMVYENTQRLLSVGGSLWNALLLLVGGLVFTFAMLVLGRILYLTAPKRARAESAR